MYCDALVDSLIQTLYKAALYGAGWVAFLGAFASALDSTNPSIYLADAADDGGSIEISVGMDDSQRRSYREYYVHRNVWIRGAKPLLQPGSIRSSAQVCPRKEFLRSEWYADFCRPLGWTKGIGATLLKDGTITANIGAFGDDRRAEYSEEDFALVRELMPHMQRALGMYRRLSESRAYGQALEQLLHGLWSPALLVGKDGSIVFMNAAAERLIRTSDGLLAADGQLRALLPDETASLHSLIGAAAETSALRNRKSGGSMRISRPYGRGALDVLISPIPGREDDWVLLKSAVAVVLITDRSGMAAVDDSDLMFRHGLTACEAKVARAASRGLTGKQICRELDISYNTLKTHLKHIYAKTRTNHQSDLVRVLFVDQRLMPPDMKRSTA